MRKQLTMASNTRNAPAMPCDALRALDAIANVASQEPDLPSLYGVIHREVSKIMACDAFYVCRYDGHARLDFVHQFDEGVLEPSFSEPLTSGPTSTCIRTREPFVLDDHNTEAHRSGRYLGQSRRSRSAIHVPLLVEGEPIGAISAQSYLPGMYDESHVRLLTVIASKAASAIRNAELRERNRRHEERLQQLTHALRVREQTLKNVEDLVMTCDADGSITAYNEAVCRALGCGPRELLGQCIVSLRTSERGDWSALRRARARRITVNAKDGRAVPVVYSTEELVEDGRTAGYLIIARNLSELREAEEAGRAALALERRRISRDLHDGLIQSLSIAQMQLRLLLKNHALDDGTRDDLLVLQETLTRGLAEARHYIADLKHVHVESDGLVRAARRYTEDFGRGAGLVIEVHSNAEESPLSDTEEVQLFFILREALNNVRKHAEATRVCIRFRREPESFEMCVEDDGCGFDLVTAPQQTGDGDHMGLPHIRERAAALGGCAEIQSRPGHGTRVCVRLPVPPSATV